MNAQIKRLQSKVNFGIKSMFEKQLKVAIGGGIKGLGNNDNDEEEDKRAKGIKSKTKKLGIISLVSMNAKSSGNPVEDWSADYRLERLT